MFGFQPFKPYGYAAMAVVIGYYIYNFKLKDPRK